MSGAASGTMVRPSFTAPLPSLPLLRESAGWYRPEPQKLTYLQSSSGFPQLPETLNISNPLNSHPTEAWSNPRKRPHNPNLSSLFESIDDDNYLRETDNDRVLHAPKRSRASEWPLRDTIEGAVSNDGKPSDNDAAHHSKRHTSTTSVRPSKFHEGSMNDKVSQKPPGIYTGDEDAMEDYMGGQGPDGTYMDASYTAGIESNKPSGMYRFGKAIANTFNPSNIWQGINGRWREKETRTSNEKQVLDDRQAKAALAYAQLKKTGYKGTQVGPVRRRSEDIPAVKVEDEGNFPRRSFRDSGVDVDSYRSSSDCKNSHQLISPNETLEIPQTRTAKSRDPSPLSDTASGRKSSLHFRKPSLQSLKKAKSHIHLPPTRNEIEGPSPVPTIEVSDQIDPSMKGPRLRKEPSKRDIAKQYKLSKKVSDLENKLEIARRELELSMSTAPPIPEMPSHVGRKPFVPGALASLPSERNMLPQGLEDNAATERNLEPPPIEAKAIVHGRKGVEEADPSRSGKGRLRRASKQSSSKENDTAPVADKIEVVKRGSKPKNGFNEAEETAKDSKQKPERPKESQVVTPTPATAPPAVSKHRLRVPSRTPQNSPIRIKEDAPPLPAMPQVTDPIKVDQAKVLDMRSDRSSKAPFGALPEDIHNLWKAYPDTAEGELSEYIRRQPGFNKITNQSSILHPARSSSLFLGRPAPASPMRTRSKGHKRGISPPPPSLASAKKVRFEAASMPDLKSENRVPSFQADDGRSFDEKPLPDIQKEDFDWDEDVF